jgi:LysR family transcriptional regulator, glycine cleavage system transcriptional activator
LLRLPGPTLPARCQYYIVHPAHRRLSADTQTFVDWLLKTAHQESRQEG